MTTNKNSKKKASVTARKNAVHAETPRVLTFQEAYEEMIVKFTSIVHSYAESKAEGTHIYLSFDGNNVQTSILFSHSGITYNVDEFSEYLSKSGQVLEDAEKRKIALGHYMQSNIVELVQVFQKFNQPLPRQLWLNLDSRANQVVSKASNDPIPTLQKAINTYRKNLETPVPAEIEDSLSRLGISLN